MAPVRLTFVLIFVLFAVAAIVCQVRLSGALFCDRSISVPRLFSPQEGEKFASR